MVQDFVILAELNNGEQSISWETSPTATYTVLGCQAGNGPYKQLADGLTFDGGRGSFGTRAKSDAHFFIIKAE